MFSAVDIKHEFCVKIPSHLTSEAGVIDRQSSCTRRISCSSVISEECKNEFVLYLFSRKGQQIQQPQRQ